MPARRRPSIASSSSTAKTPKTRATKRARAAQAPCSKVADLQRVRRGFHQGELQRRGTNDRHAAQWTSTRTNFAFPGIGDLCPCRRSTRRSSPGRLSRLGRGTHETATRVRQRIEKPFWIGRKCAATRSGENPARWKGHLDQDAADNRKAQAREAPCRSRLTETWPPSWKRCEQEQGIAARAMEFTDLDCRAHE